MSYNKYKDRDPKDTIAKYKEILKNLGSEPIETFYEATPGVWIGWLCDLKHRWSTNGKGTTKEYCMASAYGEAMERLQNMFYSSPWGYASDEALDYEGYERFRDEKYLPIADSLLLDENLYNDAVTLFTLSEKRVPINFQEMVAVWTAELKGSDICTCLPFYSVRNQKKVFLPEDILAMLVGTNGESSGNTPEEAITQGMSELFERYAEKLVCLNNLTPPEIPRNYIKENYPEHYQTMLNIESMGKNFEIKIFDYSLGINLPVVCIILIDKDLQRYRLQFGAHPLFTIALERCLTEMLQGYTPGKPFHDELFLTPWTEETNSVSQTSLNNDTRFTNGIGSFPDTAFYKKASWEFIPWRNQQDYTNKKGATNLINLALSIAPDVYIRNNSILGVPCFSIYIPQISISYYDMGQHQLLQDVSINLLKSYDPSNIWEITSKEKEDMLKYFDSEPTQGILFPKGLPPYIVNAALCVDFGRYDEALALLRNAPFYDKESRAAIRDFELKFREISEEDRNNMIEMFFGKEALTQIQKIWRKVPHVLENLYQFTSRAINDAVLYQEYDTPVNYEENGTLRNNISNFLIKIKDYSKGNPIDQSDMKEIIEGFRN